MTKRARSKFWPRLVEWCSGVELERLDLGADGSPLDAV